MSDKPEFVVVSFLESLQEGDRFPKQDWPLHVTIAPPFSLGNFSPELDQGLRNLSESQTSFAARVGSEALFGPKQDVPVNLISSDSLTELHGRIVSELEQHHASFRNRNHVETGYHPHVTHQQEGRLHEGQEITLRTIELVALTSPRDEEAREVIRSYHL